MLAGSSVSADTNNNNMVFNDSAKGKTCHQCRQKIKGLAATCQNQKDNGKACTLKFCPKCLERYNNEKAGKVEPSSNWRCPKCRGKCNCSVCQIKKGREPTGKLTKKAKSLGFESVEDMLDNDNTVAVLPMDEYTAEKEEMIGNNSSSCDKAPVSDDVSLVKPAESDKEEMIGNNSSSCDKAPVSDDVSLLKPAESDKELAVVLSKREKLEEVPLPPGTLLTNILDIEFSPENVGSAMQFLEFCRVFGEALEVKDGEAAAILREIVHKQRLRQGENFLAIQFNVRLLTMIMTDSGIRSPSLNTTNGKNSWLKALQDLISGSLVLKDFPLDWIQEGNGGYCSLDVSKKLNLLNFLCEEALGTEKLRGYLHEQHVIFREEVKASKSKVASAKEKEKYLNQKLEDEMSKADISNVSNSEHEALLSRIKSEKAQAHAELLEAKGTVPKGKQSSDAVRINPLFLDDSGRIFWKFESYAAEYAVLLQDIALHDDGTAADEKWLLYDLEKQHEIEKYISSRKLRR